MNIISKMAERLVSDGLVSVHTQLHHTEHACYLIREGGVTTWCVLYNPSQFSSAEFGGTSKINLTMYVIHRPGGS